MRPKLAAIAGLVLGTLLALALTAELSSGRGRSEPG